jgi:MFS family permease
MVTMMNGAIFYTFGVFFKPVAEDFGWSRGEFSTCYTAMLLAYAPACYLAGRLSDRRGPRSIMLIAALLIGVGFIGCSTAVNLGFLISSYAIIGFGLGATLALPTAIVQRWFVKLRGAMIGIVSAGMGIGGLIFAPWANHLIGSGGWRSAYLIMGTVIAAGVGLAAVFLEAQPAARRLRPLGYGDAGDGVIEHISRHPPGLAQAFRLGSFRGMAALYILNHIPAFLSRHTWLPSSRTVGLHRRWPLRGWG